MTTILKLCMRVEVFWDWGRYNRKNEQHKFFHSVDARECIHTYHKHLGPSYWFLPHFLSEVITPISSGLKTGPNRETCKGLKVLPLWLWRPLQTASSGKDCTGIHFWSLLINLTTHLIWRSNNATLLQWQLGGSWIPLEILILWLILKGNHLDQFTHQHEYYSACKNSCVFSGSGGSFLKSSGLCQHGL